MQIAKNTDGESGEFWKEARIARTIVEGWPEWKRKQRVTKYSVGFDSITSESNKPTVKYDKDK